MGTFDDIDLERTNSWSAPPERPSQRAAIVGGVIAIVVAVGALAWWLLAGPTPSAELERMAAANTPAARPPPAVSAPTAATALPVLDDLDPVVRRLIGEITTAPQLSKWLDTENLARQIAALVDGAASSRPPLRLLAPLRPAGAFSVVERQGRATIAPASFARYDALAGAIAALDPASVARVYRALAPRLEDAHNELGEGERTFDSALRDGLRRLSETPIPEGPISVTPHGGVYVFSDPKLEALSPAQKLLLRSGPANARRVQAQLAAIAAALGPSAVAPAPPTP